MQTHDPTSIPAVQPLDAHNRRLLENVHPPAWMNPTPKDRYHLVVIGAGTAGLVTAAIAAALGARVALVERALMGGDCLNVGCVPSKSLLAAARGWQAARDAAERFGGPAVSGEGDFAAVMERMRRIRADISPVDGAPRFAGLGVDVFLGHARFVSDDAIDVDGARLRFRRAVVATGGRAAIPAIEGMDRVACLTNETVFSLTERPEHLAILGGGPIGCELGQAFARFGARVTIIESGPRLLPHDDPHAAEIVANALRGDGVHLLTDARVDSAAPDGKGVILRGTHDGRSMEVRASHLLVAAGRAPNVEGLGLEAAGIEHDARGVAVDERMRTSNPRVYAIGDVASRFKFTHAADAQARMVVRNALFHGRGKAADLVIPWCTYTSPEVAHVGITADEAAQRGDGVRTITIGLDDLDRAKTDGETEGFVRVHVKAGSDTILGATIVGPHAGDVISQVTQAMTARIGLGAIGATVFPYPTLAEGLRRAADALNRDRLTPTARRAFGLFFRATG